MKKKLRHLILALVIGSSTTVMLSQQVAAAEVTLSGNAGILSDYIFRGIPQDDGVGNGGIDLEVKGFYAGTWIADVGEGIEYDLYAGYVHEWDNFYLGAGYTSYQYSDEFDDEYNEVNFYTGGSSGGLSLDLEYTVGEYNGTFSEGDEYTFLAVTVGYGGAYLTYGDFGDDADDDLGNYFEAGYGMELAGFDLVGAVVHTQDAEIIGTDDDDETKAYVSVSWSFDLI